LTPSWSLPPPLEGLILRLIIELFFFLVFKERAVRECKSSNIISRDLQSLKEIVGVVFSAVDFAGANFECKIISRGDLLQKLR